MADGFMTSFSVFVGNVLSLHADDKKTKRNCLTAKMTPDIMPA
jgi:hypothetical protein